MARRGFQGAVLKGLGAREHEVTVTGTEPIAAHCVRVRMSAPTLFTDALAGPTAWLRFWFPDPDGTDAEFQRGYTIVDADTDAGTFSVDFVLHEPAGPASTWAQTVRPGAALQAVSLGSRPYEVPEEPPAGYLLVGDSASLPAIRSLLEVIPAHVPVEVYLEQHHEDDPRLPLAEHPEATVHWVPRQDAASLAQAIRERDWSDWYAWVGPESGSLKHLRSRLRDTFGFPKSEMHLQAYWMEGRAMGRLRRDSTPEPGTVSAGSSTTAVSSANGSASEVSAASETAAPTAAGPTADASPADAAAVASASAAPAPAAAALETPAVPVTASATSAASAPPADTPEPSPAAGRPRGRWRARAGSRLLAPLKPVFVTAGILQALITVLQLAPYLLLVELARTLLAGDPDGRATALGIAVVIVLGAGVLLETLLLLGLHAIDARFSRDLRSRLLDKLARLPLGWFTARGSGRTTSLVRDDTMSLHYLITHAVPDAVAAVVAPVAVLVYLFAVDWRLGLLLFVPILAYVFTMYSMVVQSGSKTVLAQEWSAWMTGESAAYLDAQPVVRVFGGAAASSFRARLDEYVCFLDDWQRPFTAKKSLMDLSTRPTTFLLLICAAGTGLVVGGSLDPVDLLPFLLLGTTFGARLLGIGYGLSGLRQGLQAARTLQNTLDEPELTRRPGGAEDRPSNGDGSVGPEQEDRPVGGRTTGTENATPLGRVEVERARFSYRSGVPVLHGVSLTLEPGTLTALVGPSGSGKSTLAGLLARFHDLDSGAIRIGGRDIRSLTSDELYSRVGFVFQDVETVRGTVRENIALAVPEASDTEIEAAARAARLHERILALPQGYASVLGDDTGLSGGELQRLAIARTMLADPPVLILDEATAFADPEAEYLVQRALSELAAGRTVLVIAHRLHTVTGADHIVVLDGGRIAESGTHAELLVAGGRYRQLWDSGTGASAASEPGARESSLHPSEALSTASSASRSTSASSAPEDASASPGPSETSSAPSTPVTPESALEARRDQEVPR